jgi:uncharacterized protein
MLRLGREAPNGARAQLAATVSALRMPATYPDATRSVETIETHMAFVFLTEHLAYKLKKPIRTALLDYTTVDLRHLACNTEIDLNRRLAPDVYLAAVPVVVADGKVLVGGPGAVIDWLVKMRRLQRQRMLDTRIQQNTIEDNDIDRVSAVLARFYAAAKRPFLDGAAYRARISSDIASKHASLAQPRYGLRHDDLRTAVRGLRKWLEQFGELLEERASQVVDAHGDLRPEHICLEEPTPVVIDCLEFDEALRLLDPVSELSFLGLECRRLGAPWIGDRLLAGYIERSKDPAPAGLARFYQSYHALVRAAVAVWHLDDDALGHSEHWQARGNWYLQVAHALLL